MKILKRIGLVLLSLIAIVLIAGLFIPKKYTVSVKTTINKPKQQVYDYVKILANQKAYSEWMKPDPNVRVAYTGQDGTVGAKQAWASKVDDVGEGEMTIVAMNADRIDMDLKFVKPYSGNSKAANIFKAINDSTTEITNEFYADESYPMNIPSYIFGKSMIEKKHTQNLANIKAILEK
jgi:hypothetical protein